MHKAILNLFKFLRNCTEFIKIVVLFSILMLILYWIQNLTGDFWAWLNFANSFLDIFIDLGNSITSGSVMFFGAVFEYKYFIAILIFLTIYALSNLTYNALNYLEDLYSKGHRYIQKLEEDTFNRALEVQHSFAQKKLNRYQIYIGTQIKSKFASSNFNINMEEQNSILIEYLSKKLSVTPEIYGNGYLFTFESFPQIDSVLEVFYKLRESKAPISTFVCVQISGADIERETKQLKVMIDLNLTNKIVSCADTAYRYSFNLIRGYNTTNVGLFKRESEQYEVHEFVKND